MAPGAAAAGAAGVAAAAGAPTDAGAVTAMASICAFSALGAEGRSCRFGSEKLDIVASRVFLALIKLEFALQLGYLGLQVALLRSTRLCKLGTGWSNSAWT